VAAVAEMPTTGISDPYQGLRPPVRPCRGRVGPGNCIGPRHSGAGGTWILLADCRCRRASILWSELRQSMGGNLRDVGSI
jgi:hypothetical protein